VFVPPVLVVPPPIGRYYFLDLRPGRSFAEYAAGCGLQTSCSAGAPHPGAGPLDLDTYAQAVLAAIDTIGEITGSPDVNLIGFCAGAIIPHPVPSTWPPRTTTAVHQHFLRRHLADFAAACSDHRILRPGLVAFAGYRSRRRASSPAGRWAARSPGCGR